MNDREGGPSSIRWPWAGILAFALVLRGVVAFGILGSMPLVSDAHDYYELATRIAARDAIAAFYWPPGESLLLALSFSAFGSSVAVARAVTVAIGTTTVLFTMLLAREVASERVARVAGWLAALYVPSLLLTGQTYAQHLAGLCLAAVAYFGLRAARDPRLLFFSAAGIALGAGWVTRPSMASVAPVLVGGWVMMARRAPASRRSFMLGTAVAVSLSLALVLPICAHNARAGAGWTVSTNNERNLFLGNNPYTPDYKTSHLGQRSLAELAPEARRYLLSIYERPEPRIAMRNAAIAYMMGHPLRTAVRTFNRATSFWGFDYLASREIQAWRGWTTSATLPVLSAEAGAYLVVASLALIGVASMQNARVPRGHGWLVALALAYQAPYAIAFSGGTYHFPVMPLALPLAAGALVDARAILHRLRRSRGVWIALSALALLEGQYAYYALTMSG